MPRAAAASDPVLSRVKPSETQMASSARMRLATETSLVARLSAQAASLSRIYFSASIGSPRSTVRLASLAMTVGVAAATGAVATGAAATAVVGAEGDTGVGVGVDATVAEE